MCPNSKTLVYRGSNEDFKQIITSDLVTKVFRNIANNHLVLLIFESSEIFSEYEADDLRRSIERPLVFAEKFCALLKERSELLPALNKLLNLNDRNLSNYQQLIRRAIIPLLQEEVLNVPRIIVELDNQFTDKDSLITSGSQTGLKNPKKTNLIPSNHVPNNNQFTDKIREKDSLITIAANSVNIPATSHSNTSIKQHLPKKLYTVPGTHVRYDPLTKLGSGASSNVYAGYYRNNPAAVKIVESKHFDVYKNEISLSEELKKINEKSNLNIVTLLQWQELATSQYLIVMERASSDLNKRINDLQHLNRDRSHLTELEMKELATEQIKILRFIHGAAKGLKWMHECNKPVIHRDIKPENILIFETSLGDIAKLGDFGISRKLTRTSTGTTTGCKGTLSWMAPEAIRAYMESKPYHTTTAVDIFSLGMTARFALSLGVHPFEDKNMKYGKFEMMNIADTDVAPSVLGPPFYAADHLFSWMMDKTVENRPTALQVVQHPCFWNWKESRDFIFAVARCFDRKHDFSISEEIDEEYRKRLGNLSNWVEKLDEDIKSVLFAWKKNYNQNPDSVMKLVELIRDKYMHYRDMMEIIQNDTFTVDGNFDDEKYCNCFLTIFPELLTHLFCQIANRTEYSLGSLRKDHFKGFKSVPDWASYIS